MSVVFVEVGLMLPPRLLNSRDRRKVLETMHQPLVPARTPPYLFQKVVSPPIENCDTAVSGLSSTDRSAPWSSAEMTMNYSNGGYVKTPR